jgi:hypothetical protein
MKKDSCCPRNGHRIMIRKFLQNSISLRVSVCSDIDSSSKFSPLPLHVRVCYRASVLESLAVLLWTSLPTIGVTTMIALFAYLASNTTTESAYARLLFLGMILLSLPFALVCGCASGNIYKYSWARDVYAHCGRKYGRAALAKFLRWDRICQDVLAWITCCALAALVLGVSIPLSRGWGQFHKFGHLVVRYVHVFVCVPSCAIRSCVCTLCRRS